MIVKTWSTDVNYFSDSIIEKIYLSPSFYLSPDFPRLWKLGWKLSVEILVFCKGQFSHAAYIMNRNFYFSCRRRN